MAQNSKIEWLRPMREDGSLMEGHTANLWWGCEHVHAGCDHCYAEAWAKRYAPTGIWGRDTPRMEIGSVWINLATWQRQAAAKNEQHSVFVGSMMDIAEKPMILINRQGIVGYDASDGSPVTNEHLRQRFFREVVPVSPNLLFLFLSKRPSYYPKVIPADWVFAPPANVMYGTSVVDQATYETLKRQLLRVNGFRFLSVEPQLEPIHMTDLRGIDWVICGGESGPHRRPFNADWARAIRDQCQQQGVAFFFKQMDKVQPIPEDLLIRQFPTLVA